ncbi:oligogalacturonate lyase family protein [Hufsiella ginkgonis]|uniref:Oligogalacturonate lyase domain-containing protein n=1 Tax=Hufsiella ginkgonis TaxID=2695274 RepID=A0A7K1Y2P0_9SPHI|nr:oligogalacturonate lyase family protein [Hufsiella ginkgonis]MXV17348.1 hypothetical protein [Hufsiella ginkgonis]
MKKLIVFAMLVQVYGVSYAQPVMVTGSQKPMPAVWIDQDTGHKVMRLSGKTGAIGNWYFHNNPFFKQKGKEGDKMVFAESDGQTRQIFALNLATMAVEQLTTGSSPKRLLAMSAQKSREFIYQVGDSVFAGSIDTKRSRLAVVLPADKKGGISTVNADATYFAGKLNNDEERKILQQYPQKSQYFNRIYDAHLLNSIFTIEAKTGAMKVIHEENNWLGHIQFSPTDPNILLFCHEGPWEKVDRIWRYNIASTETTLMHKRTMPMEIAGHEFFSPKGETIWFDLQKPKGKTFFLSGTDVKTGKEVATYEMTANEWSIHFATTPSQDLFAGDGGDPTQVARAADGMWIYAFYPDGKKFRSERLVNMKGHDYRALEPNVHITPDNKWVVFGGTFEGTRETYAVQIGR